jgi:hypothetical protein
LALKSWSTTLASLGSWAPRMGRDMLGKLRKLDDAGGGREINESLIEYPGSLLLLLCDHSISWSPFLLISTTMETILHKIAIKIGLFPSYQLRRHSTDSYVESNRKVSFWITIGARTSPRFHGTMSATTQTRRHKVIEGNSFFGVRRTSQADLENWNMPTREPSRYLRKSRTLLRTFHLIHWNIWYPCYCESFLGSAVFHAVFSPIQQDQDQGVCSEPFI